MTIRQALIEKAAQARRRVCPPDHCETCYHSYYRALYIGCCVCTGDISLKALRPFSDK